MVFCFCIMCCFDTLMLDVHILPLLQYHHAHPSCGQIARKIDYGTILYSFAANFSQNILWN